MASNTDTETETDEPTEKTTDEQIGVDDVDLSDGKPPGGAIASEEDFKVKRDPDDDQPLPVWEKVPGKDKYVEVVPARQGDAEKWLPESGDPNDMSDREMVEVINRFFATPDFDLDPRNAEEELEDFLAFGVTPLIVAWYNASGFEMSRGMVMDNAELLELVEGNTSSGS